MVNINPNIPSSNTQNSKIEKYLRSGRSITALEALTLFGCFRLSGRIYDLIHQRNVPIKSKYITLANGKRVKEYYL